MVASRLLVLHSDDEMNSCSGVLVFILLRYVFVSSLVYRDSFSRCPIFVAQDSYRSTNIEIAKRIDAAFVKVQLLVKSCLPCTLRFHLFDPLFARPGLLPEASRAPSTHNTLGRSKVPQDRTPGTNVNTVSRVTNQLTVSGSRFRHIRSTEGGSQTSCLGSLY